jgi:hypothetical protein
VVTVSRGYWVCGARFAYTPPLGSQMGSERTPNPHRQMGSKRTPNPHVCAEGTADETINQSINVTPETSRQPLHMAGQLQASQLGADIDETQGAICCWIELHSPLV